MEILSQQDKKWATNELVSSELGEAFSTNGDNKLDSIIDSAKANYGKARLWLFSLLQGSSIKHKAGCVAGAFLYGTNAVTNIHRFGIARGFLDKAVSIMGAAKDLVAEVVGQDKVDTARTKGEFIKNVVTTELNAIADELKNPNIEGIPIHAESEIESQDVQVAQNLLIRETASQKEYAVDNSVPKLKTWQVKGYLMSNPYTSPLVGSLVIKPDLLAQRALLQMFVDTRLPVCFKTHDNRFYKALITHMDTQYTTQALNALAINITLTEFKVLELNQSRLSYIIAEPGSEEEING